MRKFYSFLLATVALLCCTAADAYATTGGWSSVNTAAYDGKCGDNAYWALNEETGALTIFGTGAMYNYNPDETPWYSNKENITSVTIEEGVTSIGNNAFEDCTGLTSVDIPEGVTSIGEWVFYSCTGLTSVEIPEGVTSIGLGAFYDCSGLTSIKIPSSVTIISNQAFWNCSGLTSVDIPSSVTSIGNLAFYGCSGLTNIVIPSSVTSTGNDAFQNCSGLTSIVVDEENTVYDSRGNCNAIIETASNTLLYGCENTVIPSTVTSIGESAFFYCRGLTSVVIPESVTSIGGWAFYGCYGLTSIEIPSSVTSIGTYAFYDCIGLTSIVSHIAAEDLFAPGNKAFNGIDKDACTLYVPAGAKSTYAATEQWKDFTNITEFNGKCGDNAYWALNEETGALTIFGTGAMYNYANNDANRAPWYSDRENITSVSIGSGITVIGKWALAECLFTSIELPNTLTTIKEEAFSDCSALTSITIPASVTSIEDYVFGCKSLETIVVEAGNTVYDSRNNCNAIMETSTNKLIAGSSKTVIPEETVSIGHYAFENRALTSIEIPANVTSIGNYAFLHTKLENIVIPNTVNYLGVGVFQNCDNLVSAKLPDNLTYINKNLFYQCTSLTDIEIPETVTNIDYAAFYLCSFTDINIPESVTNIGDYAFAGCWNLNKITIPAGVTNIGMLAFSNCGLNVDFECIVSHIAAEDLFAPGNKAFNGIDKNACTLYVPAGAKSTYESTDGWKEFTNIVETYDLTVTAAGYATLYLGTAVEIPAGVEAYTAARIEGDLLKMQAVEDVIPANTAVIIKAEEGNYTFIPSNETPDAIEGNLLRGTLTDTYIKPASAQTAYVLSKVDGIVGMYRAKLKADGTFKNNANRVYMLLGDINVGEGDLDTSSPGGQLSNGYRFDFSGTTAIEGIQSEQGEAVYYDLSGRRVENPVKGIYIVNGRKVLIK